MNAPKKIALFAGPIAAMLTTFWMMQYPSIPPEAARVAGLCIWMAIWWMTEPVALELTALLPMLVIPLTGLYPKDAMMKACAPYANESVYFFLGGFGLGLAIEKTQLHRVGAMVLLRYAGTNASRVVGAFMLATAGLSMWINNTATTMLMLPLAMSVIATTNHPSFSKSLLIGIAYAASIGGMGTLVGTAPNIYFAGYLKENGMEIGFREWMFIAMPVVFVLLIGCWIWMVWILWPMRGVSVEIPSAWVEMQKERTAWNSQQRTALIVFGVAAALWVFREPMLGLVQGRVIEDWLGAINDPWIAMAALACMLVFPLGAPVLEWKDVETIPWGVLLLFGGGLSLSTAISASGLDVQIGNVASMLQGIPGWLVIVCVVVLVIAISEMASNIATATTMIPVLAGAAPAMGLDPIILLSATVLASSCGFMMPVATPPNTLVFAQKKFPVRDMLMAGFGVNLLAVIAIPPAVIWIMPWVLGR
ncbi:MAG: Sodium-dependent dicarboxylate transporter SdcS [Planctomycetota bacterium]|jgi:sodium-dependent dicarboxylate transporter 2/3/5